VIDVPTYDLLLRMWGTRAQSMDDLSTELRRVRIFLSFDRTQRIWWLYLREAVERWLLWNDDAVMRAACDRLSSCPEDMPDEGERWLDLRRAVEQMLAQKSELSREKVACSKLSATQPGPQFPR